MQLLTFETFASHLHETFALELGDSHIDIALVEATKLKPNRYPGMQREPFRLRFKCAKQTILPQKIYPFSHADMGKLGIFIVPIGRDRDGIVYEAIFN